MENFFTLKKIWKDGGPSPHVLVLLSEYEEFREYARAHHDLLAEHAEFGVIPEEWLHSTVQGIHHAVDTEQLAQLCGTSAMRWPTWSRSRSSSAFRYGLVSPP
ncbi:hypothetical protein [Streptomyces coffeae]|uniref:Uncharacterized protein n=1 Tax=Streptomyces coffeae TaxID=621382 RepID=A0ABS1NHT6_9ACTN|nr:hypothetical protein [Streptomyces coffeae]MBL1099494.1 hypothetical protein [Streptomyces coffeae]